MDGRPQEELLKLYSDVEALSYTTVLQDSELVHDKELTGQI